MYCDVINFDVTGVYLSCYYEQFSLTVVVHD